MKNRSDEYAGYGGISHSEVCCIAGAICGRYIVVEIPNIDKPYQWQNSWLDVA